MNRFTIRYGRLGWAAIVPITTLLAWTTYARGASSISAERRAEDYAQAKVDRRQQSLDRKELVVPAPKNFRPSGSARELKLRLTLEKIHVRVGELLCYRLEIVNSGAEPYDYLERPSFFKSGRMPHDRINLILRTPDGSTATLRSPYGTASTMGGGEIQFASGTSESEKAERISLMQRDANAASKLFVTLAPGETLRTRGDGLKSAFRRLLTRDKIESPGIYELYAELDGLFKPGLRSNSVRFTISP